MSLFALIKYLELVAAIAGTIYYRKYAGTYLRFFLYLLWIVLTVEFAIDLLKDDLGLRFQNNFIYNILTSVQYIYFFQLYERTLSSERYKRCVRYFRLIFIVAVCINFAWFQRLTLQAPFHSYTFTLGAMLLIVTIAFFLMEILNSEKIVYFKRYLMFWISIGLFLFYGGVIPYMIGLNLLSPLLSTDSLAIIFFSLNLVMYAAFTIGFVFSKPYVE